MGRKAGSLAVRLFVCLLSSVFMLDMKMEAGAPLGLSQSNNCVMEGEDGQDTPCVVYRACTRTWQKEEKKMTDW